MNNQKTYQSLIAKLSKYPNSTGDDWGVFLGDSLEVLKSIPDNSISLILTDPPYHVTKKSNIKGDKDFKLDQDFIAWMEEFAKEWARILKPNGSLFCYCAPKMSAYLEVAFSKYFNVLSHVVWTKPNEPGFDGWKQKMKKEALRQWYDHSERILFAEPAFAGNLHKSYFGNLLREKRKEAGLSGHQLTEMVGAYGKVNHGGAVSNWEAGRNVPSRDQYKKICEALVSTDKVEKMPDYEDVIRPFNVSAKEAFTDVWEFPSVRPFKGKHPAEKPLAMLEHAIRSTTYPGDIVLDCFAGSGNSVLAAINLDRYGIGIDLDELWFERAIDRMKAGKIAPHVTQKDQVAITPLDV